ncbi:glycerophosphodiester phosphodiesterase family protein [Acuticoccus sp. MNP-M23]|uniref:glycerophosphodiester phosphodiesterase n=1 Tax=Acuticoccus sp. MNP-M23 TaxID=3072793 RepID=UPI0028155D6F|nr:glycerophosphodiester phosphodiesterase family protein [Acuticoccus sp. MNP-M23]WMS43207.1 glycerophosphodiester phosphodiesterase family protein [Acuticoccus sp. MNP-M23]
MLKLLGTIALATTMTVPALAAADDLSGRDLPGWDVVLVAHRGLAPGLPENTMAAFEDVVARGVGVIEIDLRGTADGDVVIMHDETVDRTTDGTGPVTSLTLSQIKALDAGRHAGDAYAGATVPTFEEALAFAQANGVMLLLDIKESDVLDREKIVRLVEAHHATLNVIVGVRSLEDLAEFRALNPNLRTLGFIPNPEAIDAFAEAGVEIIRLWPVWIRGESTEKRGAIPADCEGVENCLVSRVQSHNRPVWTTAGTADRAELIDLMAAGVNGILTDVPDVMATLKADIEKQRTAD